MSVVAVHQRGAAPDDLVELVEVGGRQRGVVPAAAAQPAIRRQGGGRCAHGRQDRIGGASVVQAHRAPGGGHADEVQVEVAQAGHDGRGPNIVHCCPACGGIQHVQAAAGGDDAAIGHADGLGGLDSTIG
jgi:hypothetical protein